MNPIVGIGELLWDIYPDGRKEMGGAPFNFAFHCHQLGHEAVIVSRIGDDDLGRELREEVKRLGMSDEFIQTDYEHPTGTVRVTLDDKGQPSYEIVQDVAWDFIRINNELLSLVNCCRTFCFGTLAQRSGGTRSTIRRLKTRLIDRLDDDLLIVFDINLRRPVVDRQLILDSLGLCNWVKINSDELVKIAEHFHFPNSSMRSMSLDLRLLSHNDLVCVTDGANGIWLSAIEDEFAELAAPANVIDTVGAGDAFTAAMVVMHLEGKPLKDCARFASHYAAKVCEHRGATPKIDRSEIEKVVFR